MFVARRQEGAAVADKIVKHVDHLCKASVRKGQEGRYQGCAVDGRAGLVPSKHTSRPYLHTFHKINAQPFGEGVELFEELPHV